jgi:hypothetical protein
MQNFRSILLDSACRDRNRFPNQFDFETSYSSQGTTAITALDFVSDASPIVNYDMGNYFATISGAGAPYRWEQTGLIVNATTNNTNNFLVTIDARLNVTAPDPVIDQYVGCEFVYNDGTNDYHATITAFEPKSSTDYLMTIDTFINVTNAAGDDDFTILAPWLDLNQIYIPAGYIALNRINAYSQLFLTELDQTTNQIVTYNQISRVLTLSADLANDGVNPPRYIIITASQSIYNYEIQTVNNVTKTITVNVADHPNLANVDFSGWYIYQYTNDATAQILSSTSNGIVFTFVFAANIDLSLFNVADLIGLDKIAYDNASSLAYKEPTQETKAQDQSATRTYSVQLESLIIPNKKLDSYPGGLPVNLDYVVVEIRNVSNEQRIDQTIYSNNLLLNGSEKRISFVAYKAISTLPLADYVQFLGCGILQFNIKSNDILKITIRDRMGNILKFQNPDHSPPVAPNPTIQISAFMNVYHTWPQVNCNPGLRRS